MKYAEENDEYFNNLADQALAEYHEQQDAETARYGQPHDFNNREKRCKCGLYKVDYDSIRHDDTQQNPLAICRLPHEPKDESPC